MAGTLALAGAPAGVQASPPGRISGLDVTFVGNAGFLVEGGGRKVLIDALVSDARRTYVNQGRALRRDLLGARPPFDDVDLVLATHVHGDHFDPTAVLAHLAANSRATFVSTEQARARLLGRSAPATTASRIRGIRPPTGGSVRLEELGLTVLDLHHGRDTHPAVQNHGFIVELGDLRVLHVGDTEVVADELAAFRLADDPVDLALLPSWYLDAAPWVGAVERAIRPRMAVAMHLAPGWDEGARGSYPEQSRRRVQRIRRAHPETIVFRAPGERRRLTIPAPDPLD